MDLIPDVRSLRPIWDWFGKSLAWSPTRFANGEARKVESPKEHRDVVLDATDEANASFDHARWDIEEAEASIMCGFCARAGVHEAEVFSTLDSVLTNEAAPIISTYQHRPLDRNRTSIRLISVLSELSYDGFIQCFMWHDTIEAQYTSLSYVWGSGEEQQVILLDTKPFRVRKNLFEFLEVARKKYPMRKFWIDALCIDQSSILERNHQVAQMGLIYTEAESVISWLGHSHGIESALRFCAEVPNMLGHQLRWNDAPGNYRRARAELPNLWSSRPSDIIRGWNELRNHQYWKRAWITQEIMCAKQFKILVNLFEIDAWSISVVVALLPRTDAIRGRFVQQRISTYKRLFDEYLRTRFCVANDRKPLVELLGMLPGRVSQLPRDRLYSLLPIASDTSSFPVDYASCNADVVHHTVKHLKGRMCLCLWSYIANSLEYPVDSHCKRSDTLLVNFQLRPCFIDHEYPLSNYATTRTQCSFCARGPLPIDTFDGQAFCLEQLCGAVSNVHVYLGGASARRRIERIVPEDQILDVHGVYIDADPLGDQTLGSKSFPASALYDIQLTARNLAKLLRTSDPVQESGYQSRIPLELCRNTHGNSKGLNFQITSDQDMEPASSADTYFVVLIVPANSSSRNPYGVLGHDTSGD